MDKFSANPYTLTNQLISSQDVINLMKPLEITDFTIHNLSLYQTAFIHKSYCFLKEYEQYDYPGKHCLPLQKNSYETMEFLGDAILGSVVSSYIYKRFHMIHGEKEGFLTKLKIRIVCGDNLCQLSNTMKLNKHIILSDYIETQCDGRNNKNILEDVFEALIGAIYLDHSYEVAETFITAVIEKYIDLTELLLTDNNYKDQISRYLQKNYKVYPAYQHEKKEDVYYCKLLQEGKVISVGEGNSKKRSEQEASRKALIHFNVLT